MITRALQLGNRLPLTAEELDLSPSKLRRGYTPREAAARDMLIAATADRYQWTLKGYAEDLGISVDRVGWTFDALVGMKVLYPVKGYFIPTPFGWYAARRNKWIPRAHPHGGSKYMFLLDYIHQGLAVNVNHLPQSPSGVPAPRQVAADLEALGIVQVDPHGVIRYTGRWQEEHAKARGFTRAA